MIFNMIAMGAGAGGALDNTNALVIATVPAGSTVTATKSGVVKTPTMWIANADSTTEKAVFQIPPAEFDQTTPWTITTTDGTSTASATVLITTNKEYDINLSNILYLYNNGDLCDAITGGWGYAAFLNTSNYENGALNTAYKGTTCYLLASGTSKQISAVTKSKVDVTNYNALKIEISDYIFYGAGYHHVYLLNSRTNVASPLSQVQISSTGEFTADVSSVTGSYYIGLYLNSGTTGSCAIGFTKMYLSK